LIQKIVLSLLHGFIFLFSFFFFLLPFSFSAVAPAFIVQYTTAPTESTTTHAGDRIASVVFHDGNRALRAKFNRLVVQRELLLIFFAVLLCQMGFGCLATEAHGLLATSGFDARKTFPESQLNGSPPLVVCDQFKKSCHDH